VRPDASFTARYPSEAPSRLTVRLASGKAVTHEVSDFPGFPTRPFTWHEIEEKLEELTADRADVGLRRDIAGAVRSLESIRVKDLMNLLARVDVPALQAR
jgi:2-methylcitrate dehydratase